MAIYWQKLTYLNNPKFDLLIGFGEAKMNKFKFLLFQSKVDNQTLLWKFYDSRVDQKFSSAPQVS